MRSKLTVRPCSIRAAKAWCAETHRRLPKINGGLWAVALYEGDTMAGCAIVGWPARVWMDRNVLSVLRVAVAEGTPNGCSKLYGAVAKAAKAMGAADVVTYTHQDEPGTSLRAAGWVLAGETAGGQWDTPTRRRQPALFPDPKRRWLAPWGVMAKGENR